MLIPFIWIFFEDLLLRKDIMQILGGLSHLLCVSLYYFPINIHIPSSVFWKWCLFVIKKVPLNGKQWDEVHVFFGSCLVCMSFYGCKEERPIKGTEALRGGFGYCSEVSGWNSNQKRQQNQGRSRAYYFLHLSLKSFASLWTVFPFLPVFFTSFMTLICICLSDWSVWSPDARTFLCSFLCCGGWPISGLP